MSPARLGVPEHFRGARFDHVTLVVDYRHGTVHALTGQTARIWAATATDGAETITATHARLADAGLLTERGSRRPPVPGKATELSFGAEEYQAGTAEHQRRAPTALGLRAVLALILTLTVRGAGPTPGTMARLLRLVERAHRTTRRPATPAEATAAVQTVRAVARWVPVRVACLEESVAAVIALALARAGVTWCHGVATDPHSLHAWIECDGTPVAEPASTSRFTTLRTIPEPHQETE
ncbi:lasso peptide biosynthesis B2 protein [Antribacter gilvus]|uniref:lasso peptide biosynthesis B2 protein n=1 Tax=Antribacter gilvus TaxID=2304675 RepID=UPI0013DF66A4|nr:lasso peptide biosynthesis B2 protein [Antribacter gilvus]